MHALASSLAGILLGVIVLLLLASVIFREWLGMGMPWIEDLSRWALMWTVFLGVAVAARDNDHISMEAVFDRLPQAWQSGLSKVHAVAGLGLAVMLVWLGWQNTERVIRLGQSSASGQLPGWIGYSALPVGFGIVVLAYLAYLIAGGRARRTELEGDLAMRGEL